MSKQAQRAVSFDVSAEDARLIRKIVEGAIDAGFPKKDGLALEMDITAVHANGCPLRLHELLGARKFDFLHDVFGIHRHINRNTGTLMDCFVPRYAAKVPA